DLAEGGQVVAVLIVRLIRVAGGDGDENRTVAGRPAEFGHQHRILDPAGGGQALEVENDPVPTGPVGFRHERRYQALAGRGGGEHRRRPLVVELGAVVVGHDGQGRGAVEVGPGQGI